MNSAAKCTYIHKSQEHRLWVQFSARQEQIVSDRTQKKAWLAVFLSCVSWKEVQWFSMEERLTPGVLWAATCACFRGLQGWKTRVGWETWLCFTLVLQELPAVKVYVSVAEGLRHYADVYMDFLLSYPLQLLTEFLPLYPSIFIRFTRAE